MNNREVSIMKILERKDKMSLSEITRIYLEENNIIDPSERLKIDEKMFWNDRILKELRKMVKEDSIDVVGENMFKLKVEK